MRYKIFNFKDKFSEKGIDIASGTGMTIFDLELRGIFPDCDWSFQSEGNCIELSKDFSEYPKILERYGEVIENAVF